MTSQTVATALTTTPMMRPTRPMTSPRPPSLAPRPLHLLSSLTICGSASQPSAKLVPETRRTLRRHLSTATLVIWCVDCVSYPSRILLVIHRSFFLSPSVPPQFMCQTCDSLRHPPSTNKATPALREAVPGPPLPGGLHFRISLIPTSPSPTSPGLSSLGGGDSLPPVSSRRARRPSDSSDEESNLPEQPSPTKAKTELPLLTHPSSPGPSGHRRSPSALSFRRRSSSSLVGGPRSLDTPAAPLASIRDQRHRGNRSDTSDGRGTSMEDRRNKRNKGRVRKKRSRRRSHSSSSDSSTSSSSDSADSSSSSSDSSSDSSRSEDSLSTDSDSNNESDSPSARTAADSRKERRKELRRRAREAAKRLARQAARERSVRPGRTRSRV